MNMHYHCKKVLYWHLTIVNHIKQSDYITQIKVITNEYYLHLPVHTYTYMYYWRCLYFLCYVNLALVDIIFCLRRPCINLQMFCGFSKNMGWSRVFNSRDSPKRRSHHTAGDCMKRSLRHTLSSCFKHDVLWAS